MTKTKLRQAGYKDRRILVTDDLAKALQEVCNARLIRPVMLFFLYSLVFLALPNHPALLASTMRLSVRTCLWAAVCARTMRHVCASLSAHVFGQQCAPEPCATYAPFCPHMSLGSSVRQHHAPVSVPPWSPLHALSCVHGVGREGRCSFALSLACPATDTLEGRCHRSDRGLAYIVNGADERAKAAG
eukprot:213452-Chlamydomonas_euryale.AAC.14